MGRTRSIMREQEVFIGGMSAEASQQFSQSVAPVPTTFYHGQKDVTTAGTEVVLGSAQALSNGVIVKAKHANTGFIYVGKNPVTSTTGYVLDAGEAVLVLTDNVADVFIDSSVNGEGVSWIGA